MEFGKPKKSQNGYFYVLEIGSKKKYGKEKYHLLHRIIWVEANGPIPDGMEIHHKNEIKTDNRLENLECLTPQEHRIRHAKYAQSLNRHQKLLLHVGGKGSKKYKKLHEYKLDNARKRKLEKGWIKIRRLGYKETLAKLKLKKPTPHQKTALAMMLKGETHWLRYKARKAKNEAARRARCAESKS